MKKELTRNLSTKTTVRIIRHGETNWNLLKKVQGQLDVPLNSTGLKQAAELSRFFEENRNRNKIDEIYSSDLIRAKKTAEIIAHDLGIVLKLDASLRERACGKFEGLNVDEINASFPIEFSKWKNSDPDFVPPGNAESQKVFFDRAIKVLKKIVSLHQCKNIIIVTHGGFLDSIYRHVKKMSLEQQRDVPLFNASISTFVFDLNGKAKIASWGDISHLKNSFTLDSGIGDLR